MDKKGFIIALAWADTYCKQAGGWYDPLMKWTGFNKGHCYKAGHAALILVDDKGDCRYFDFGRYHSPYQYGRVRDEQTDPELGIKTKGVISNQIIENIEDILNEVAFNPACHGDGNLKASYCPISYEQAYIKAKEMQMACPIPYGPFQWGATNCSRFVHTIMMAGNPSFSHWLKLRFPYTLTPSPLSNVNALNQKFFVKVPHSGHKPNISIKDTKTTLPKPEKAFSIPENAQWLSGEGAGSWYAITKENGLYMISRFDSDGKLEDKGNFNIIAQPTHFEINKPYQFTYLSNSLNVNILQAGKVFSFDRI